MKIDSFQDFVLKLPRIAKRGIVFILDVFLCISSVWVAFYLRLGEFINIFDNKTSFNLIFPIGVSIAIALPIFIYDGLYRLIFRYSSWPALMTVSRSLAKYCLIYSLIFTFIGVDGVPRTIGFIQPILLLLSVGASRAFARFWLGGQYQYLLKLQDLPNVMIYGAGKAGRELSAALVSGKEVNIIGFIDDDPRLHKHYIDGFEVFSSDNFGYLVNKFRLNEIYLALPSCSRKRRNDIIDSLRPYQILINTIPSITELTKGKYRISDVRDLDLDDLLGRDPVIPDPLIASRNIEDKIVMITGAGGSIGSELCRQVCSLSPKSLVLVDQNEFSLYKIHQDLISLNILEESCIYPVLASIRDDGRVSKILKRWRPQTIYHAAAYKHVPLLEYNAAEGIENNVFGTSILANSALNYGVENFILISTDKAVRPTNLMGASKRVSELVLQALAHNTPCTTYSMVRFGNVLGSSGSVVPRFREQIKNGGPVTITHEEVTRYFMTIPEASQLVIQAGAMASGGDVFVLDMGQPVKIMDLAKRMVELSGLTLRNELSPEGDIELKITGLRPGEKLYEELLIGDNPLPTSHPRIMKAHERFIDMQTLDKELIELKKLLVENDIINIRNHIRRIVPEYEPDGIIVDWHHSFNSLQQ